jgi:cytosine/adenosine deaminase-related metal-dependent hydrolase
MAKICGAQIMGKNSLGGLEVGYDADFLVFDLNHDACFPLNNAVR